MGGWYEIKRWVSEAGWLGGKEDDHWVHLHVYDVLHSYIILTTTTITITQLNSYITSTRYTYITQLNSYITSRRYTYTYILLVVVVVVALTHK